MRVILDTRICVGHGRCYSLAPEQFEPDDEGHARLVTEEVPDSRRDRVLITVQNCPEGAISKED